MEDYCSVTAHPDCQSPSRTLIDCDPLLIQHGDIIGEFKEGIGVVSDHTVMSVGRVEQGFEHTALSTQRPCADGQHGGGVVANST